jgi:hypothetical protein
MLLNLVPCSCGDIIFYPAMCHSDTEVGGSLGFADIIIIIIIIIIIMIGVEIIARGKILSVNCKFLGIS